MYTPIVETKTLFLVIIIPIIIRVLGAHNKYYKTK